MSQPNENTLLDVLAANQKTERNKLHEIETSDVAISPEALSAIGKAARSLLSRVMGATGAGSLDLGEIVRLFASRMYWNETGGELIMCAQVGDKTLCLPVPADHWSVNTDGRLQ